MTPPAPQFYTAAQIARALGGKRQAVARALASAPADGCQVVSGQTAQAWSFCALPVSMQVALEDAAQRQGCRNPEALLAGAQNAAPAAPAVSCPARPPVTSLAVEMDFARLREAVASFKDPAQPNASEKGYLWLVVFEVYEEKTADGKAPKKLKRSLLKWLAAHASFLVSTRATAAPELLRVNFHQRHKKWLASGRAAASQVDRRAEHSGRWRAPELTGADRDKITGHAVLNCGGRVSQAWRELVDRAELSEAVTGYYLANPSRKSYVPRAVRELVRHEVALLEDIHHGPRQAKLNGAHLARDWSGVHAMDWFQADDFTFPVYFTAPDGQGWFSLMRGQALLMIDLRSARILGFVLISERNYNANAIHSLITRVADEHGLPRIGFYFENGSWRAKILKGSEDGPMGWGETEMGLREFGLKFVHARLPRAKPVEGIGGAMQNLMEGLPGYVGRNEQTEKFERVQKLMLQVKARKLDPAGLFMTEDQWAEKLQHLCEQYNAAPQNGKMTVGLSPDAAFEQFRNAGDPPVKFSADCRYLLAHHRRPVRVNNNGITLRFGNRVFNYRNADTGRLIGQTVFAWFNPEMPETLTVTDKRRQNPFCVARSQEVPAMEAPAELLSQEMARIAEHQAHAKARYRVLKARCAMPFRAMIADRETVELGAEIGRQREAVESTQRENQRHETKGRKLSLKLGMALPADKLRRPEMGPALERLTELLDSDETETIPTQGEKS